MNTSQSLGHYLHAYFEDHLVCQKGLQVTTVRSYRDTIRLFLQFIAAEKHIKLTRMQYSDLTSNHVLSFFQYIEKERGNGVATRNQRLAALRSFFEYLANRIPEMLIEAQRVAAVPTKRTKPPRTIFIEKDEAEALFDEKWLKTPQALRDRTLLLFLYNTGARAQEVADLCVNNYDSNPKPRVHLHGKGDKWRVCPLWLQTATLLDELIISFAKEPEHPVFVSRTGRALTRFGIYKIVRRYVTQCDSIKNSSSISPHSFRHAAAVNLLESGVDINVIRAWLGHVSLETTNRYAEISLRMKAEALQACEPPMHPSMAHLQKSKWRDDESLLKWLESI
jgi:integrase/recombinase XerD